MTAQTKYRVLLSGHSHRRMVRAPGGLTFINAGTLFRAHQPCLTLIDFERSEVRFFDWRGERWQPEPQLHPLHTPSGAHGS